MYLRFEYFLGQKPLIFADSEKDLGVTVNVNFSFNDHCLNLLTKANK